MKGKYIALKPPGRETLYAPKTIKTGIQQYSNHEICPENHESLRFWHLMDGYIYIYMDITALSVWQTRTSHHIPSRTQSSPLGHCFSFFALEASSLLPTSGAANGPFASLRPFYVDNFPSLTHGCQKLTSYPLPSAQKNHQRSDEIMVTLVRSS